MSQIQRGVLTSVEPRRALLVDNERCMLHMLSRLLGRHGFETDNALSAEQARSLLGAHPLNHWSMIVVDLNLTDGSGLSLARWLRVSGLKREVPIVLCTGSVASTVDQQATRAGCDAVLRKPFQLHTFTALLNQLEERRVVSSHGTTGAPLCNADTLTSH